MSAEHSYKKIYKASFPATVMIAGEHAVVYGSRSIVAAIDEHLEIKAALLLDQKNLISPLIYLNSSMGSATFNLRDKTLESEQACFDYFKHLMIYLDQIYELKPCELSITRSINPSLGLGSSSAFVCALLSALNALHQWSLSRHQMLRILLDITRKKSPLASGSDLAACLYGGLIAYNPKNLSVKPLNFHNFKKITLVYSGYKTPTFKVLEMLKEKRKNSKEKLDQIFLEISSCTENIIEAFVQNDEDKLDILFDEHQQYFENLDLVCDKMRVIYNSMKKDRNLSFVKTSGSGLGDCLLAFNHTDLNHTSKQDKQNQMRFEIAQVSPLT